MAHTGASAGLEHPEKEMSMPTTMTLYTYAAIAAPLTQALTEVIERQVAAWGPTLDETIAEMLVRALAANGAEGAHQRVLDRLKSGSGACRRASRRPMWPWWKGRICTSTPFFPMRSLPP
jgi:hypothetical protein